MSGMLAIKFVQTKADVNSRLVKLRVGGRVTCGEETEERRELNRAKETR